MPTDTFNSGSGTFTVPASVTSLFIEEWGAGGGGSVNGPAGGGGGAYVAKTLVVTAGSGINWQVGGGGNGANNNAINGNSSIIEFGAGQRLLAGGGQGGRLSGDGGPGGIGTGGDTNTTGGSGVNSSTGPPYTGGTAGGPGGGAGGTTGTNGSAPGGGGGGGGPPAGSGAFGRVQFTYSFAGTSLSGNIPLYINTGCAAGLLSSGDVQVGSLTSQYPSGHWFNYLGGSGLFWNYVNTDPTSQITDTDWIFTTQSGFLNRTSKIWYDSIISGLVSIDYYNLSSNTYTSGLVSDISQAFDIKDGWMVGTNSTATAINIQRDNSEYSSIIDIAEKTIVGAPAVAVLFDRKYKRIFYISSPNTILWSVKYDGTNIQQVLTSTYSMKSLAIDYKNNKLYVLADLIPGNPTSASTISFDLITLLPCIQNLGYTGAGLNNIAYGTKTDTLYIDNLFAKQTIGPLCGSSFAPLGTQSGIGGLNSTNGNALRVDELQNQIYFLSGLSEIYKCNLNGGSMTSLKRGLIYSINIDGPGYVSKIDFNLTDLPPGFGTNALNEQVTNAYVSIKGKEGFDFTNVYAKVLKSDLKTIIWENYPESCAQFPVASGQMVQNIGFTGSRINPSVNTLGDWNGAILRLECYSLNDTQPSGNFTIYSAQVNTYCSGNVIQGTSVTSGISLFISASDTTSGSIPLYIPGQLTASGLPLYIGGLGSLSGIIPLYISGAYPNAVLPLFMFGPQISSGNGFIPLTITSLGSGVSGVLNNLPLFLEGNQSPTQSLPLYILNQQTSFMSGFLPLLMAGVLSGINGTVPLFIANNYAMSGLPLYMKGIDTTINIPFDLLPNGIPFSSNISLFINRANFVSTLPLFICNTQASGGLSLYQQGTIQVSGVMPLVIPSTRGSGTGSMPLNIVGW